MYWFVCSVYILELVLTGLEVGTRQYYGVVSSPLERLMQHLSKSKSKRDLAFRTVDVVGDLLCVNNIEEIKDALEEKLLKFVNLNRSHAISHRRYIGL